MRRRAKRLAGSCMMGCPGMVRSRSRWMIETQLDWRLMGLLGSGLVGARESLPRSGASKSLWNSSDIWSSIGVDAVWSLCCGRGREVALDISFVSSTTREQAAGERRRSQEEIGAEEEEIGPGHGREGGCLCFRRARGDDSKKERRQRQEEVEPETEEEVEVEEEEIGPGHGREGGCLCFWRARGDGSEKQRRQSQEEVEPETEEEVGAEERR